MGNTSHITLEQACLRQRIPRPYVSDDEAGNVVAAYYQRNDPGSSMLHREDGPALIKTLANGRRIETYYLRGSICREDGPAIVETRSDGTVISTYYDRTGIHRKGAPAVVEEHADGSRVDLYLLHGLYRQSQLGPARVVIAADGTLEREVWFHDGQFSPEPKAS